MSLVIAAFCSLGLGALLMLSGELYAAFGSWEYRNPEAMAPTPRRIRIARYSGAIYIVLGLAMLVGAAWRGDKPTHAWAFAIALWVGLAVTVVLAIVLRGWEQRRDARRAAARRPWKHLLSGHELEEVLEQAHAEAEEVSPSEPSEAAYAYAYLVLGIHVALLLVVSFLVISWAG